MKILMALMGLEIGGAETHVVELSKALKGMGHDIVVASNGGVYQKELEEYSIRHIKIPLHSKRPDCFFKSYFALKKLFDTENFDIVHAHARIPAYICGLLEKKYSFRFVTTAHWVFKITPLWKRLANWGEKTIAVSDDIKEYLIKNYGIWSDNISTTINGIDLNKFSKSTDWSDIKKEFDLNDDKYRILYVSRMDDSRSAVAFMCASVMPEILKIKPNAELIIVGDGNDFDRLKSHTDKINAEIGHNAIKLTGARVDINKFVASSDAFVGVSRSALEAMAAGIPVIIAGNEGYIGIFSEDKFKVSFDTNFCCRGCEEASDELVLRDLKRIISLSESELKEMSDYNKKTIETYYSAYAMASDYDKMYTTLTPLKRYKRGNIIINGYYGYSNIGDDALLQATVENIKKSNPDAKITVLSASPKETASRYLVRSIHRYNFFKIIREMKNADIFISGGGSLLQDVTSTKSLIYYTAMMKIAKRLGLKVLVFANGFGPVTKKKNLKRVKDALLCADYVSMREPESFEKIKELTENCSVTVSADPAFCLEGCSDKWKERLLNKFNIDKDKKYFALCLREWQENDKNISEKIVQFCLKMQKEHSLYPVFVAMQSNKDLPLSEEIRKKLPFDAPLVYNVSAKELISILCEMEFSIGMRLHFLIFSAVAKIPIIALSYDPKINSLMNYMELDSSLYSKDIDLESLYEVTEKILLNREETVGHIEKKAAQMKLISQNDAINAVK